jgi:hypothetical protein
MGEVVRVMPDLKSQEEGTSKKMMSNMTKGKIAEKIAIQMFKKAGFKVKKAGYENTFTDLADKNNLLKGPAGQLIRHHPDLIVIDKQNNAYFVEVKFRKYGVIDQKDLFNYPETQVILFTKDSIHCQNLKDIHKHGKKFLSLRSLKPFSDIPQSLIDKYTKKVKRTLGDENFFGQLIEEFSQKIVGKTFRQPLTEGKIKFTYVEDYMSDGYYYENTGEKETISSVSGINISSSTNNEWSDYKIQILKEYYRSGMSVNDISRNIHRSRKSLVLQLVKEGLVDIRNVSLLIKGGKLKTKRYPKNRSTTRNFQVRGKKTLSRGHGRGGKGNVKGQKKRNSSKNRRSTSERKRTKKN